MRKGWVVAAATTVLLTACGEDGGGTPPDGGDTNVSGEITVLTNRTDQVSDGTLAKYAARFRKLHPNVRIAFEGITDYEGETRTRMDANTDPWAAGKDLNTIDGLLYSAVHEKLTEADPTTTDWESSKSLLGSGKIGTMLLGSWAVPQIRKAAEAAGHNPDDIGYMPFPALHNGHLCTVVQPDYKYAVNVHSRNRAAARAWIDWYLTESGSAQAEEAISTVKGTPLPPALKTFDDRGVRIMAETQDRASVVSRIDKGAQIGLDAPDYRRKLVDIARGAAPGDRDGYFADLNKRWAQSLKKLGG